MTATRPRQLALTREELEAIRKNLDPGTRTRNVHGIEVKRYDPPPRKNSRRNGGSADPGSRNRRPQTP